MKRVCSRRKFIFATLSASSVLLGAGLLMGSCDSKKAVQEEEESTASVDSCSDLSGVSEAEIEKREKLGYVNESPIPDNRCDNCKLYLPSGADKACGGCMLFKGPVYASGYCTYWAPQV